MNKYLRGLLSGASFAALNFGMFAGTARAAGAHISVAHSTHAAISNNTTLDYIFVGPGGEVAGDIVNHGIIGPPGGAFAAIAIANGVVDGILSNASDGLITVPASSVGKWGVMVSDPTGSVDEIYNAGSIIVHHRGGPGGAISITGAAHARSIVNDGLIKVTGTGNEYGFIQKQVGSVSATPPGGVFPTVLARYSAGTGGRLSVSNHFATHGNPVSVHKTIAHNHPVILQYASNTGTGRARALLTNAGAIKISNVVTATATGAVPVAANVVASVGGAGAPAIKQHVEGHDGHDTLDNSGVLKIKVNAKASQGFRVDAQAQIEGIWQFATGRSQPGDILVDQFDNHGGAARVTIKDFAQASGAEVAVTNTTHYHPVHIRGNAIISDGLVQELLNAGHMTAAITNSGGAHLNISAIASGRHIAATSAGHHAMVLADARIHDAISQFAESGRTAKLSIRNSGASSFRIRMGAHVSANSGNADGFAWQRQALSSQGALVVQAAEFADKVTELLINDGSFRISANATVNARTGRAVARAVGATAVSNVTQLSGGVHFTTNYRLLGIQGLNGILQRATQGVDTANLQLHNDSNVSIQARATATAGRTDSALARIGYGIGQSGHGHGGGHASAELTNLGELKILANAQGQGATNMATATAIIGQGLKQYVTGDGQFNKAGIHNFSDVTISANAVAGGLGHNAPKPHTGLAHATVQTGIRQTAGSSGSGHYAPTGSAILQNAGALVIKAKGAATVHYIAQVEAIVSEGIAQNAFGQDHALASLSNLGHLAIYATASGHAYGAADSIVYAHIGAGIRQSASGYQTAQAVLSNHALHHITIQATANADGAQVAGHYSSAHRANADADIAIGIKQFAAVTDTSGHLASVSLHNSGTIYVKAHGKASGTSYAQATGHIGTAVAQSQSGPGRATLDNHGFLAITASATALVAGGAAHAQADIQHGIKQKVVASGATAHATLTNSGELAISALAFAGSTNSHFPADAIAHATISTGILQFANHMDEAYVRAANHGLLRERAQATASGGIATAFANVLGGIRQNATQIADAHLSAVNSGTINISAHVVANGGVLGTARARFTGVAQTGDNDLAAHMTAINSGLLSVKALARAVATGTHHAAAIVGDIFTSNGGTAIRQRFFGTAAETGQLAVRNKAHGSILLTGTAVAEGGHILANAGMTAVKQVASLFEGAAGLTVENDGLIQVAVKGQAIGSVSAFGFSGSHVAVHAAGIVQGVSQSRSFSSAGGTAAPVTIHLVNDGSLSVSALAINPGVAQMEADAAGAVLALSGHLDVNADFHNGGHITVQARAEGPNAFVRANGFDVTGQDTIMALANYYQYFASVQSSTHVQISAPITLNLVAVNSGSLKVKATATAGQDAVATGIHEGILRDTVDFHNRVVTASNFFTSTRFASQAAPFSGKIENDGLLSAAAIAPHGKAEAFGIRITAGTMAADIVNKGTLSAAASGKTATATGIAVANFRSHQTHLRTANGATFFKSSQTSGASPANITGSVENDGTIKVTAKASGAAIARGISLNEQGLTGRLLNSGKISAVATGSAAVATGVRLFASASVHYQRYKQVGSTGAGTHATGTSHIPQAHSITGTVENDGTISAIAKSAAAKAKGLVLDVTNFNGTILNKGTIKAEADGVGGQAVALQVSDFPAPPTGTGTISNVGGTISAKLVNGGVTSWGTAIDVSNAPNPMNIGLSGNGTIYGNVKLKSNSAVTVSGPGVTFFSGIINLSKTKAGTLTIAAGGNLELANDAAQGNAKAYVTSFSQLGTLSVDIGSVANATPYINAGAATLGGALVVVPGSVLPAAATTYRIVLSDAALSTTWSGVTIKGAPALLSASAVYLPNEADISLSLTQAGNLGLTPNQLATLTPFEQTLAGLLGQNSIDPNSGLGKLVTALFKLTLPQLTDVLDQLGDQDAGAQTRGNLSFATALLDQILNHLGAGGATGGVASLPDMPAGVRPAQMTTGAGTIWGGLYGAHASTKSVAGTPGSSISLTGLYAGYDLALDTDLLAGAAVAYSTDTSKTGGGHGSANGFQVSPYLRLTRDSGFFANADVSFGIYTNKLSRTLTIPGLGTGTNTGKFDSNVFSAYAEAGHSFANGSLTLSPYAALAYARADAGAYTETGALTGTLLHVNGATSQTLTSYLGAGLSETFALDGGGTITPRMRFAWAHDYSGSAWQVNAGFAALPGSGFAIRGPGLSREKAYINAALDLHLSDEVETSLNYDALFNDDQSQQSLMGVLRFSF